jgi:SAM-dependent methyltransferase
MSAPLGAWDAAWQGRLAEAPAGLDAPTLENHIDAGKLAFLGDRLPRAGRAVEIGCGSARLLARVCRAAPLAGHAVDPSPEAIRLAAGTSAALAAPMTRLRGDALALPFRSASFDLVLSGGLLEHFEDPRPVLAEMVRILRPGGTFYADVVPRKLSLYRLRELPAMLRGSFSIAGVHESSFGPGFYRRALAELGCGDIAVRGAGVYPPRSGPGWARRTAAWDGTWIADRLGWYFMIVARRGPRP